jgi:2-keto-4-pentenoate hydratase/2-oxohepta-3-ene-1,7-dioic acid hydratase in catechol pathway
MRENRLDLYVDGDKNKQVSFVVRKLINAGYTGRNQKEVKKHVDELKEMGVPAPESVPTYYLKSSMLLTTDDFYEVVDEDSTGEAEYALLIGKNRIYVAVGSDHTDRKLEITSIPKAKQLSPNFISSSVWLFEDVKEQWDEIELRSWIGRGRDTLYQEATLAAFMRPEELLERVKALLGGNLEEGTVIFSGTVGALVKGMPFSDSFEVELLDRNKNRSLTCDYNLQVLEL